MAKASIKVETITKMVPTEVEEESFTLTLSREEAEALHDIFRHVGGVGRREHATSINNALNSVLMTDSWAPFKDDIEKGSRVYFEGK